MLFRKNASMVVAEDALPGRTDQTMPIPDAHFVNGNPLSGPWPEGMRTAAFAMGCFWGVERKFWQLAGVHSTFVGYAGGFTPNATYEEVCSGLTGHTEAVVVVFDPDVVSYERLLQTFWEEHDPTQGMRQGNDVGSQYRSAIFVTDPGQQAVIDASHAVFQERLTAAGYGEITSEVAPPRPVLGFLLCRAVSPAVPRQEPERVLRCRRHRCELPHRPHHLTALLRSSSTSVASRNCGWLGRFGSGPAGGSDVVAVGVEGSSAPAQRPGCRRQSGDQALHRCPVDGGDGSAGGVVRVGGDVGHVEHRPDGGFGCGECVDHFVLRTDCAPVGHDLLEFEAVLDATLERCEAVVVADTEHLHHACAMLSLLVDTATQRPSAHR